MASRSAQTAVMRDRRCNAPERRVGRLDFRDVEIGFGYEIELVDEGLDWSDVGKGDEGMWR